MGPYLICDIPVEVRQMRLLLLLQVGSGDLWGGLLQIVTYAPYLKWLPGVLISHHPSPPTQLWSQQMCGLSARTSGSVPTMGNLYRVPRRPKTCIG